MITHVWSKRNERTFDCYIKRDFFTFFSLLSTLEPGCLIEFSTIGGYDANDTYMEQCIIESNQRPRGFDIKEGYGTEPFKIFSKRWQPEELSRYIDDLPFNITRFAFETSDGIFCQNTDRYRCDGFSLQIPHAGVDAFIEALLSFEPDLAAFLLQSVKMESSYLIYSKERLRLIVPDIKYIDHFLEHEFLTLQDLL